MWIYRILRKPSGAIIEHNKQHLSTTEPAIALQLPSSQAWCDPSLSLSFVPRRTSGFVWNMLAFTYSVLLTWPASMQIYWNQIRRFHNKRAQFPRDLFEKPTSPTWPPFHCFRTPIWPPWRHVKTIYRLEVCYNLGLNIRSFPKKRVGMRPKS